LANLDEAEAFARVKNADIAFCRGIVFRLKSIGVNDERVLCTAFLVQTGSSFDEVFARFGREIATMVASITKDRTITRQLQEKQYVRQLQEAPWESVLVKLCEISASLKVIKESELSKAKKSKMLKQNIYYLNVLKKNIVENKVKTPGIEKLLDGANEVICFFKHKPIQF
jgi:hypothetical protein